MGKVVHFWCIYYIIRHISTNIFIFLYIDTYLTFHEYFSITICLILFIDCNTQDDSVLYNIVQNAMADDSFHDQIINFSWLNSCISHIIFVATFYISFYMCI